MALKPANQTFEGAHGRADPELNAESSPNWEQSGDPREVQPYKPYQQKAGFQWNQTTFIEQFEKPIICWGDKWILWIARLAAEWSGNRPDWKSNSVQRFRRDWVHNGQTWKVWWEKEQAEGAKSFPERRADEGKRWMDIRKSLG